MLGNIVCRFSSGCTGRGGVCSTGGVIPRELSWRVDIPFVRAFVGTSFDHFLKPNGVRNGIKTGRVSGKTSLGKL